MGSRGDSAGGRHKTSIRCCMGTITLLISRSCSYLFFFPRGLEGEVGGLQPCGM